MDSEIKDVSSIQDEDVLRRMWQQTEDFGKKKEIRAHMYKLREARLKEFYTTGEVLKDVQRSNSSPGFREENVQKSNTKWVEGGVTHADSLADHSFLSLKSKEIRDSESPTRDVQYKNSKNRCDNDGSWTIASKTEKSNDGKMVTNTQLATTQGSRPVDGGNMAYAAINQQQSSVYNDGDANNFTKARGESSSTFAQQEVVAGDENNFKSSKTVSSSSSSRFVSHSSSTSGNVNEAPSFPIQLQIEDGVSRSTKESVSSKKQTQSQQEQVQKEQSTTAVTRNVEERSSTVSPGSNTTVVTTKTTYSSELPEDLKKGLLDGSTKVTKETKTLPDGSTVTTTRYETKGSKQWCTTSGSNQVSSTTSSSNRQEQRSSSKTSSTHIDNQQQQLETGGNQKKTVITTATKTIDNYPGADKIQIVKTQRQDGGDIHINTYQQENVVRKEQDVKVSRDNALNQSVKVTKKTTVTDQDYLQQVPQSETTTTSTSTEKTTKTTLSSAKSDHQTNVAQDQKHAQNTTIEFIVEIPRDGNEPRIQPARDVTPAKETATPRKKEPAAVRPQEIELTKSCKPTAEPYKPSEPTEGQYSTTYRSEFTPKRISVDISPTHDAFVRSLRSKTPERETDRFPSRGQSTSSLRSSPEKKSPERKPSYDRRSPDKFDAGKRHTTSPNRVSISPERNYTMTTTTTTASSKYSTEHTAASNKKRSSISSRKSPERPVTSSPCRTPSPTKSHPSSPTKNTDVIITTKTTATTSSTRSSKSPDKVDRRSPDKMPTTPRVGPSRSPTKTTTTATTTTTVNTDTITRKKKPEDGNKISKPIDLSTSINSDEVTIISKTGTITKRKHTDVTETTDAKKPLASQDASPTTSVSDFEFVTSNSNSHMVTDLDEPVDEPLNVITTKKVATQQESTPKPSKQKEPKERPPLKRSETYEERCRKILGLAEPEKPVTRKESIPNEYEGRAPVEEPLFVKKHIDYGHPEDNIIRRTTDRIKNRKVERKEPVDITDFIEIERDILTDETTTKDKKDLDDVPGYMRPILKVSPEERDRMILETRQREVSPEKEPRRPSQTQGEYTTEYTDKYDEKTVEEKVTKSRTTENTSQIDITMKERSISPERKLPSSKDTADTATVPGYMRPIPKVTTEERDRIILETRQRGVSPEKEPRRSSSPTQGEYTTEYTDKYDEKTCKERVTASRTTENLSQIDITVDEKKIDRKPLRQSPVKESPRKKSETIDSSSMKISKTYKQIETPVREKSPEKKKKPTKPKKKNRKPTDSDTSSTTSDDEETEDMDEYFRNELKINRKSPSPVRRVPENERKSPSIETLDRVSPARSIPEDKTVTEYINENCEIAKETELFKIPGENISITETDFITREKYDTSMRFDLAKETEQKPHIRTHRIESPERETSPRRQPQKAVPSETTECRIITSKTSENISKKSPKTTPEDRSKSPTKDAKKDDVKTTFVTTTSSSSTITTKKSSTDSRRVSDDLSKKKAPKEKSPDRRSPSPSPSPKTAPKKDHVEQITRKCSKKEITLKSVPDTTRPKSAKPVPTRTPSTDGPVRKQASATSPDRKPVKQTSKTSVIKPTTDTAKKHVVTKTISVTNRPEPRSQPLSSTKDTTTTTTTTTTTICGGRSFSPTKSSPRTITSIKTAKITQPASITVTKVTKTSATTKTTKSKDYEPSDYESDHDIVNLKTNIINNNLKNKLITTTSKFTVKNHKEPSSSSSSPQGKPKQPNVTMPSIKRSTSSREPSPDKICPVPVTSDDEYGHPRYPDQVSEPDDVPLSSRNKPAPKIRDIPLTEGEDVTNFNRITEVTTTTTTSSALKTSPSPRITDIDKVAETDESLLSVTEKVTKFINTAEKLSVNEPVRSKSPAPKVPRPELVVSEDLKEDECLLSVSDKVSKFITTAEEVATKKPDKSQPVTRGEDTVREFKVEANDECLKSVTEKVSHFINAAETSKQIKTTRDKPETKVTRSEIIDVDENLRADECLLSVTDKVNRFSTTTTETNKTKTEAFLKKERASPERTVPAVKREKSPEKKPITPALVHAPSRKSPERSSPERTCSRPHSESVRKSSLEPSTADQVSRPKSEPQIPLDSKPLKSSEAVKKAKAMFENISKTQEAPKQRDILSRPSIWEGRKKQDETTTKTTEVRKQLNYDRKEDRKELKDVTLKSTKLILGENKNITVTCESPERDDLPGYMRPIPKVSTEERDQLIIETRLRESRTPERDTYRKTVLEEETIEISSVKQPVTITNGDHLPGYMRPLQRCLSPDREQKKTVQEQEEIIIETTPPKRSHSPPERDIPGYMKPLQRRTSTSPTRDEIKSPSTVDIIPDDSPRGAKKFGVTLRRTDSGRVISSERRRSSIPGQPIIEEIQDLETLEKMMDTVVGYEQRRRIRAQIRNVKKLLSENKFASIKKTTTVTKQQQHSTSPVRGDVTSHKTISRDQDRRSPSKTIKSSQSDYKTVSVSRERSKSPTDIKKKTSSVDKRQQFSTSSRIEKKSDLFITGKERSVSPETKRRSTCLSQLDKKGSFTTATTTRTETLFRERSKSPEIKNTSSASSYKITSSYSAATHSEQQKTERRSTSRERSMSPNGKTSSPVLSTSATKMFKTDLKHVQPKTRNVHDDKPSWVTNRNLRKTAEKQTASATTTTRTTSTSVSAAAAKKIDQTKRSPSPQKDKMKDCCVTSSYGIGPTDENGLPLFGIRALRKATADNVHVSGTVVKSEFYSENGNEPVGEISVTKYSTDPKELNIKHSKNKGFTAITTTQKFGSRGAPTFSELNDKKKAITEKQNHDDEIIESTSTKNTRRGSVKALSQKFIDNAAEVASKEKQTFYPKAGLILRTSSFKDSTQSSRERTRATQSSSRESSPGYQSRPTKISLESITSDTRKSTTVSSTTTTSTQKQEDNNSKTFLNNHTRVTNAQDVITRMKNAEKEQIEGESTEDREARILLNKFLGAQVLLTGLEPLMGTGSSAQSAVSSSAQLVRKVQKTKTSNNNNAPNKESAKQLSIKQRFQCPITPEVLENIWDEQTLRALLEQCTDYEERRAIRARLRQVMAEHEAVANIISSAVAERDSSDNRHSVHERIETSKKTFSEGPVTTTQEVSSRVISKQQITNKPMSPFAKFRQLDKQNSLNTPPSSPRTPTGSGAPFFKFTDPALSQSASTIKDRLLYWCQMKTREYENVKLENFSTSWADGLAFCALIHHFLPNAFDYHALTPQQRRHNFTLAFKVADEQAGIFPLLDVDDMVAMRRPDWKSVFTYVQSIYRRFKDED